MTGVMINSVILENTLILKMKLLDFVEKFPELEVVIRQYDLAAGCCLLCTCLFDTLEEIEKSKSLNFDLLISHADKLMKEKL